MLPTFAMQDLATVEGRLAAMAELLKRLEKRGDPELVGIARIVSAELKASAPSL